MRTDFRHRPDLARFLDLSPRPLLERGDDAQAARSRLDNIKRRLDDATQKLSWCTICAPASGLVVLAKDWRPPDDRPASGYSWLYTQHVLQAPDGVDFGFLRGRRGSAVGRESH